MQAQLKLVGKSEVLKKIKFALMISSQQGEKTKSIHIAEINNCGFCLPENQESCPGQGKECHSCGKRNHFASKCRQERKAVGNCDQGEEEMYQADEVSILRLDDLQLVTLKVDADNFTLFQADTRPNVPQLHGIIQGLQVEGSSVYGEIILPSFWTAVW